MINPTPACPAPSPDLLPWADSATPRRAGVLLGSQSGLWHITQQLLLAHGSRVLCARLPHMRFIQQGCIKLVMLTVKNLSLAFCCSWAIWGPGDTSRLNNNLQRPGLWLPSQPTLPPPKLGIVIRCDFPYLARPRSPGMYRLEVRIRSIIFPQAFKLSSVENAERGKYCTPRLSSCSLTYCHVCLSAWSTLLSKLLENKFQTSKHFAPE